MSISERNRNAADDGGRSAPPKGVFFCPDCGRTAAPDEWEWTDADGVETLECPDCGATLTTRPRLLA